jgi:hypothetical protein
MGYLLAIKKMVYSLLKNVKNKSEIPFVSNFENLREKSMMLFVK